MAHGNRGEHAGLTVALAPMQSLKHAKGPEDDWTGLRDRAERRRLQTRLNVRAHRQRKAVTGQQQHYHAHQGSVAVMAPYTAPEAVHSVAAGHLVARPPVPTGPPASRQYSDDCLSPSSSSGFHHPIFTDPILPLPASKPYQTLLASFSPQSHCPANHFPLSSDHLIPLIEYNVYRASLTNIYILSLFRLLRNPGCAYLLHPEPPLFPVHHDDNDNDRGDAAAAGLSTSNSTNYYYYNNHNRSVPDSLRPTELQRTVPHELWIDIIPSPRMRDNAITAVREGRLDEDGICADVLKGLCGGAKKTGRRLQPLAEEQQQQEGEEEEEEGGEDARLIVWTNPWEAGGWEVTEGFARKYGFLLKGCDDIWRATNRYRRERGDEPLVWEVVE